MKVQPTPHQQSNTAKTSTKGKKSFIIGILMLVVLLTFIYFRKSGLPKEAGPASMDKLALTVPTATAIVAAPSQPPVPPHQDIAATSADPNAPAPADLPDTVADAILLLQKNDMVGLVNMLGQPEQMDEWRQEILDHGRVTSTMYMMPVVYLRSLLPSDQMRLMMQQMNVPVDEHLVESYGQPYGPGMSSQSQDRAAIFLSKLQTIQNQTPKMSDDGMHASYQLDPPAADGSTVVFFVNIEGHWYLQ